jgi:iron(III) transport system substrate-binding protein
MGSVADSSPDLYGRTLEFLLRCFAMRRWIFLLLLVAAGCSGEADNKTTIIVYSPHGKELLTEFEKRFEAQNPGIDVRWLDMGAQDALDRVRSEKANPQADLWWGAPSTTFSQAENEGLLDAYKPTWAGQVDAAAHSPGDAWYGTYQTPEVIAYNSEALTSETAPQDWDEMLDPKWKDRIIIRDPLASGTMTTIFAAMILRKMGPDKSAEPGYAWLKQLDASTKEYAANQTFMIQKLGRQEAILTLWNMPDIELQRAKYNYPLAYIIPKSGTPVLTDAIAIVKGTKHRKEAESFYEFVTTPESLAFAAKEFYRIPSRNDIPKETLPEWMQKLNIPRMDMDWAMVEAKSKEWMEYWDSNIRGSRGR